MAFRRGSFTPRLFILDKIKKYNLELEPLVLLHTLSIIMKSNWTITVGVPPLLLDSSSVQAKISNSFESRFGDK